ncbi:hypothetical protein IKD49_02725 [Candidatus Saccharibacteria bacterium]|nr:hypothetical protein [Candidatus Saccharibacteria bacterium]
MAKVFARWVSKVDERKLKEKIRYMRIKGLKRSTERKKSKIAPAAWQEFIEI